MAATLTRRRTRDAAVAGSFYPASPPALRSLVGRLLDGAPVGAASAAPPGALIAPHAGYVYSGPVAASAFARARPWLGRARRVVVIGPSHYVRFRGLATSGAGAFATPLGELAIDVEAEARLAGLPAVIELPEAHAREHCLEVELPFLQEVLGELPIVALVVGDATAQEVGGALDLLRGDDDGETLIVVSSDLSHYLDYDSARRVDAATSRAIEDLRWESIEPDHACGATAIAGLLWWARRRGLAASTLDLRSSGDTAGPRDAVVGYGAWMFT
jgi:AmmeMemoRadiSam system protein B